MSGATEKAWKLITQRTTGGSGMTCQCFWAIIWATWPRQSLMSAKEQRICYTYTSTVSSALVWNCIWQRTQKANDIFFIENPHTWSNTNLRPLYIRHWAPASPWIALGFTVGCTTFYQRVKSMQLFHLLTNYNQALGRDVLRRWPCSNRSQIDYVRIM